MKLNNKNCKAARRLYGKSNVILIKEVIMTRAVNKMLAVVLSFAMIITGFTFLGGAVSVNAASGDTVLKVKVVDNNNDPLEGIEPYLSPYDPEEEAYSTNETWDFAATDENGFTELDISDPSDSDLGDAWEFYVFEDDGHMMFNIEVPGQDYEYDAANVILNKADDDSYYVDSVNGDDYSEESPYVLTLKSGEDPQPEGFEVTFDPGEEGTLSEEDQTATTDADGRLATLPVPVVEDEELVFAGWFMFGPDGEEEIDVTSDTVFTSDATVFAKYENVWVWEATDFTYGEWSTASEKDIEAVYPGNETSIYLTDTLWVVTGFSAVGAEKLKQNQFLEIPEKDPDGKAVQGVAPSAFSGTKLSNKLQSVTFPEGVMTSENIYNNDTWKNYANRELTERGSFIIGRNAFNKNELTYLELPEGVLSVGQAAFSGNQLEEVTLPSTLMVINTQAFAATNFNRNENQITKVNFPKETDFRLSIRVQAFNGCALEEVVLPKDTLQVAVASASTKACAFTGNIGKEEVTEGTAVEKRGGVVYMYMEQTPGTDISLIANTESGFPQTSANQKLITDQAIVEVKQAVNDAEDALGEAWMAQDEYNEATAEEKEAALANAEAKSEAAAKAAESAQKAAEEAKAKYGEDSVEAGLMEDAAVEAKNTGLFANKVLSEVKSEAAKAASAKAAAAAPGTAAQVAAAQVAADKASEAKAAADKVVAAMKELGYGGEDASDEMKQDLADAEQAAKDAGTAAQNANKALADAKTAAGNASAAAAAAAAEAARQGTPDPSLPKVTAKKGTAKKTSVTVKWKKLSKKNQKKAGQIEIWVCTDKKFAAANTKIKFASKKKSSAKVSGLKKKTTYYVKVRSVKMVNGVKHVGKWSRVKTIKTKK